jgi:hypothetical protein
VTESDARSRLIQSGEIMCQACQQLDSKIKHYRLVATQGFDGLTTERINELIKELEQRKAAMH